LAAIIGLLGREIVAHGAELRLSVTSFTLLSVDNGAREQHWTKKTVG
jgi:hypothetical protein